MNNNVPRANENNLVKTGAYLALVGLDLFATGGSVYFVLHTGWQLGFATSLTLAGALYDLNVRLSPRSGISNNGSNNEVPTTQAHQQLPPNTNAQPRHTRGTTFVSNGALARHLRNDHSPAPVRPVNRGSTHHATQPSVMHGLPRL